MDTIEALTTRSTAKSYGDIPPTKDHLATILEAAVRAPDHGRLRPWRFMLIEGAQRQKFGDILAAAALRRTPALSAGDLQRERDKLTDPYGIHMVNMVIVHSRIEAERQWDTLMPTIHDEAVYQVSGLHASEPRRGRPRCTVVRLRLSGRDCRAQCGCDDPAQPDFGENVTGLHLGIGPADVLWSSCDCSDR